MIPQRIPAGRPKRPYLQTQVGVRLPSDLVVVLDRECRSRGVRRSTLVIAALRRHLGAPAPADAANGEK